MKVSASPTGNFPNAFSASPTCMKKHGVKKGDRVTIYLPMIPEAAYAMLACTRIGAVHSIVFGGFSPDSLQNRIEDADSKLIITADEGLRGGKPVPLKKNVDAALAKCKGGEKVLVVRRTGNPVPWTPGRDLWLHDELPTVSAECPRRRNARRRSALHSLYVGIDGETQRCRTYDGRLSRSTPR